MRYATLKKNDVANAPGICVSLYEQGCPHRCFGCFNKETWDFLGGKEFTYDTLQEIIEALTANGIKRNLCILGGEPLCQNNLFMTLLVVNTVKEKLPDTKIYIWTGYVLNELLNGDMDTNKIKQILSQCEAVIDGPYIDAQRDITLKMRGSRNQRIIYIKDIPELKENKI